MQILSGLAIVVVVMTGSAYSNVLQTFESPNEQDGGRFGWSVARVPDTNDDGIDEILVGAYGEAAGPGFDRAGRVYLFSGTSGEVLQTFASPNQQAYGYFGFSIAGMEDLNGDGAGDVAIGAVFEDSDDHVNAGRVYFFSGGTGSLLREALSPNQEIAGYFGYALAAVGDADGDGIEDLAVGAVGEDPGNSPENAGRVYVLSGQNDAVIHTLQMPDEEQGARFGAAVSAAGDTDMDGFSDLVVGVPDAGDMNEGRALVFSGQTGAVIYDLRSLEQVRDGRFGTSVSKVGDLFGSAFPSIVIGAPGEGESGRAYIVSGHDGEIARTLVSPHEGIGGAYFGRSLAGIGDMNDDVSPDIAVNALVEGERQAYGGVVYVFSGETFDILSTLRSPDEAIERSGFGWALAGAGDQDSDGYDDIIVGAYSEHVASGFFESGRAYVFSGSGSAAEDGSRTLPEVLTIDGPWPNPTSGATRIVVQVPGTGSDKVRLALYDALGRLVDKGSRDLQTDEGRIELRWAPADNLPAGTYWWQATLNGSVARKRMVFIR